MHSNLVCVCFLDLSSLSSSLSLAALSSKLRQPVRPGRAPRIVKLSPPNHHFIISLYSKNCRSLYCDNYFVFCK